MAGDTIAAVATAPGRGGIGIVRVSGPRAADIAIAMLGELPKPRRATHAHFRDADGTVLDDGIALYFPAPRSFTGEDILELHGHGGPVVLDLVLECTLALGARPARPGEFSERAFLNGKLDLAQAEAVADLIDSASTQAARAALRSLSGAFSESVGAVVDDIAELRAYVEASMDFPEEEVDFLAEGDIVARTRAVCEQVEALQRLATDGALLRDGLQVAIMGPPNAGKSSLLNRLALRDAAIVTDVPGTTRDPLRETVTVDGIPLHLVDTAGLREGGDAIEQEGMRRARAELARADHVLWVVDCRDPDSAPPPVPPGCRLTVVLNKVDLADGLYGEQGRQPGSADPPRVRISALTGEGVDALVEHLKAAAGWTAADGAFSARRRHRDALARAERHLAFGMEALESRHAGELLAEELRLAEEALGEITGRRTTEDLLGRIFASFCIGK